MSDLHSKPPKAGIDQQPKGGKRRSRLFDADPYAMFIDEAVPGLPPSPAPVAAPEPEAPAAAPEPEAPAAAPEPDSPVFHDPLDDDEGGWQEPEIEERDPTGPIRVRVGPPVGGSQESRMEPWQPDLVEGEEPPRIDELVVDTEGAGREGGMSGAHYHGEGFVEAVELPPGYGELAAPQEVAPSLKPPADESIPPLDMPSQEEEDALFGLGEDDKDPVPQTPADIIEEEDLPYRPAGPGASEVPDLRLPSASPDLAGIEDDPDETSDQDMDEAERKFFHDMGMDLTLAPDTDSWMDEDGAGSAPKAASTSWTSEDEECRPFAAPPTAKAAKRSPLPVVLVALFVVVAAMVVWSQLQDEPVEVAGTAAGSKSPPPVAPAGGTAPSVQPLGHALLAADDHPTEPDAPAEDGSDGEGTVPSAADMGDAGAVPAGADEGEGASSQQTEAPVAGTASSSGAAPAGAARGRVELKSDERAVVFMAGRRLGETPLPEMELPPGTHTLRAISRTSGAIRAVEVEVKAGQAVVAEFRFGM